MNRLGRFSALDGAAPDSADPQSMNRYSYVENDPANSVDPSGEDLIIDGFDESDFAPPWSFGVSMITEAGWDEFSLISLATTPTAEVLDETDWFLDLGSNGSGNPITTDTSLMYLDTTVNSISYIYGNSSALDFGGLSGGGGNTPAPADWLPKGIATLKTFSTDSTDCLKDLKALGLTADKIQNYAKNLKTTNALTNHFYLSNWPSGGVDFVADTKAQPPTLAYNSFNFWQTSFGDMLGTLVHEYAHFENPSAGDSGLQKALGVPVQKDTTDISKKLAKDCFRGAKTP